MRVQFLLGSLCGALILMLAALIAPDPPGLHSHLSIPWDRLAIAVLSIVATSLAYFGMAKS